MYVHDSFIHILGDIIMFNTSFVKVIKEQKAKKENAFDRVTHNSNKAVESFKANVTALRNLRNAQEALRAHNEQVQLQQQIHEQVQRTNEELLRQQQQHMNMMNNMF